MSPNYPLYKRLAMTVNAWRNCQKSGNVFSKNHEELSVLLVNHYMPHGSGINNGITLKLDESTGNKLVFYFSYHFMDEQGFYDGWEDYKLIVTPSLIGNFDIKTIGKNRNDIKDHFYQIFEFALNELTYVEYQNGEYILV